MTLCYCDILNANIFVYYPYSLLTEESLSTSNFQLISERFKSTLDVERADAKNEIGKLVAKLLYHHVYFLPKLTDKIIAMFILYDLYDKTDCLANPFCGIIFDIIVSWLCVPEPSFPLNPFICFLRTFVHTNRSSYFLAISSQIANLHRAIRKRNR